MLAAINTGISLSDLDFTDGKKTKKPGQDKLPWL